MNSALSLALGLAPLSTMPPFSDFVIPNALAILDFSANDSIVWDNTGTPSISSIKYKNNAALSASCTDKSRQPIADFINGKQAAKFDGADDYLQFNSRLSTIRTVLWVGQLSIAINHYDDTWLGLSDNLGVYFGVGPTFALLDTSYTNALWNNTWYLNGAAVNPTTTPAPIGNNFSLIMQTTSNGDAEYISRDRDFPSRGMPIILGEIQISSQIFTEAELLEFDSQLRNKWGF